VVESLEDVGGALVQEGDLLLRGGAEHVEDHVELAAVVLVALHQHAELLVHLVLRRHAARGAEGLEVLGAQLAAAGRGRGRGRRWERGRSQS
jgi:hypothetical protein